MIVSFINQGKTHEIEIQNIQNLNAKEIINQFEKMWIYFSDKCRKDNLCFLINDTESKNLKPFSTITNNSKLSIKLIGNFVTINYNFLQFNFQENESIPNVKNEIKKYFNGKFSVSIYYNDKYLYRDYEYLKKNELNRIEVQFTIKFSKENTQYSTKLLLDYFSTVYDAQKKISITKTDETINFYVYPRHVSIWGKCKMKHDKNKFLYNIQDLRGTFFFDYRYSTKPPKKSEKKDKPKSPIQKLTSNSTIQKMNPSLTIQKLTPNSTIQKMNPSLSTQKLTPNSTIQKSPIQKLTPNSTIQKSPIQKKKDSVGSKIDKKENSEKENCLLISFVLEGFYPIQKNVPLSNTIDQVKEMIANEKNLKKEKISIKYMNNDQKVELNSNEKISNIGHLIKEKVSNKMLNVLYVELINDQKQIKKSIKQFKPTIKKEENHDEDKDDDNCHNDEDKDDDNGNNDDDDDNDNGNNDDDDDDDNDNDEINKNLSKSKKLRISHFKPKVRPLGEPNDNILTKKKSDSKKAKSDVKEVKLDSKKIKYFYQTNVESEINEIEMYEEATVRDMKEKIREERGIKNLSDIKIIFAGKELLNDLVLEKLKIGDIKLFIYIRTQEDILLLTAKALQINEYSTDESYYEEEDDDD